MPLHLIKLAVGIDDVEHLRLVRAASSWLIVALDRV